MADVTSLGGYSGQTTEALVALAGDDCDDRFSAYPEDLDRQLFGFIRANAQSINLST